MSTDVVSLGLSRQRALKDQLSPYKLAVLILIEDHCRTSNGADVVSYSDVEEFTFLTTLLQLIQVVI